MDSALPGIAADAPIFDPAAFRLTPQEAALTETVRAFVPEGRRYITLGTDGFGRSDTRAALRQFFGVDAQAVAKAARFALGL